MFFPMYKMCSIHSIHFENMLLQTWHPGKGVVPLNNSHDRTQSLQVQDFKNKGPPVLRIENP